MCCLSTCTGHLQLLENMFKSLQTAGLTLKPSNEQFEPREDKYLGHVLTANGIRIGDDCLKAKLDLPTPTAMKKVRSLSGMVNFLRKFIPNVAGIIAPELPS